METAAQAQAQLKKRKLSSFIDSHKSKSLAKVVKKDTIKVSGVAAAANPKNIVALDAIPFKKSNFTEYEPTPDVLAFKRIYEKNSQERNKELQERSKGIKEKKVRFSPES